MFELLTLIVFVWLLVKAIGLVFKITWGAAKVIASILIAVAMPLLLVILFFTGGILLIVPVLMIGLAVGILNACI